MTEFDLDIWKSRTPLEENPDKKSMNTCVFVSKDLYIYIYIYKTVFVSKDTLKLHLCLHCV